MKLFARLLSFWIPFPKYRKKVRNILEYVFFASPLFNIDIINAHLRAKKVGKNLRISAKTRLNEEAYIGNYNCFNGLKVIGKGKFITHDAIRCGKDLLVLTQNHNYESDLLPYGKDIIKKDVIIDNYVWIGSRVTLLPGTHICEGAIIQAGSVVHGTIPPLAIAGGNPAKVFKYRNKEHYEKLKKENKVFIATQ